MLVTLRTVQTPNYIIGTVNGCGIKISSIKHYLELQYGVKITKAITIYELLDNVYSSLIVRSFNERVYHNLIISAANGVLTLSAPRKQSINLRGTDSMEISYDCPYLLLPRELYSNVKQIHISTES